MSSNSIPSTLVYSGGAVLTSDGFAGGSEGFLLVGYIFGELDNTLSVISKHQQEPQYTNLYEVFLKHAAFCTHGGIRLKKVV